jgi:long-chain fatty acid transport protein
MSPSYSLPWRDCFVRAVLPGACSLSAMPHAQGQGSASLGNGISASALARGGINSIGLHWKNQGAFHAGFELPVRESVSIRGGYSFATNPVPSSTLTPMTAAIAQNALAAGVGWSRHRWNYDDAYQVQLPSIKSVGTSVLLAGEYNNSSVEVWTQSITVSARVKF